MRTLLKQLKSYWMKFAHALGWVNTRLILTLAYIIIIGIPAIIMWLLRKDPLHRRFSKGTSYWTDKEPVPHTIEHAKHLF
jgi:uncharacterized iron-regulated membrane protein